MKGPQGPDGAKAEGRLEGLDVARGVLLIGMVLVHVVSAHAAAAQAQAFHGGFGIFLISSGFVALSGYVAALGTRPLDRGLVLGALDEAAQLVLVMFAYGVLLSLMQYGLATVSGGSTACSVRFGWVPPTRFEDLGILLPIALVRFQAAFARGPRMVSGVLALLAVGWMMLPELGRSAAPGTWWSHIAGVLTGRSLTPFYTVSTFVALGLVGAVIARFGPRLLQRKYPAYVSIAALAAAVALATPSLSQTVLDQAYRLGPFVGGMATLLYWTTAIALLAVGFSSPWGERAGAFRRMAGLLGRHSLLAFVLHDVFLVLDSFVRSVFGLDKGLWVVALFFISNVALLLFICRAVDRAEPLQRVASALLLGRRRGSVLRAGAFSLSGALALAGVLAAYSGMALAGAQKQVWIDDFESPTCPVWWTFGTLGYRLAPTSDANHGGAVLEVRGEAAGMFAHGRGLYMDQDIGDRRTLALEVRGYGPGSGRLKLELLEDDNGNWEIEKDPKLYTPMYDDRLTLEMEVDWWGWRQLSLPVSAFRDDNPEAGNNQFDPQRDLTSGGLLETQLLFSPATIASNQVRIDVDNIRWLP